MNSRYLRGKGKTNCDYSLKDLYKEYKKQVKNPVDYTTYVSVLKEYNDRIMKLIIYSNLSFKMPYRLGYLHGQKTKTKTLPDRSDDIIDVEKMPVDWDATLRYWGKTYPDKTKEEIKAIKGKRKIRHLNLHTDGWRCRFYWDKIISNVKNQSYYIFKASRTNKERMSSFAKEKQDILYYE
jgi:hypothetical protein